MRFSHENDYDDAVQMAAARWNVDPSIIKGVIGQESNFIPTAYRFEPYISPTTGKPRVWLGPTPDFPQGGDASFGLMQMLVRTARLFGFTGPKEDLYDPATNVDLGTHYLSNLITKYTALGKPLQNALSEYNGGSGSTFGGAPAGGPFTNQAYVNNVMSNISYFQEAGGEAESYITGESPGDISSDPLTADTSWSVPTQTAAVGGGAVLLIGLVIGGLLLAKKR